MSEPTKIVAFPAEGLPQAWEWLHQFPKSNFDDYAPGDYQAFKEEMFLRVQCEKIFGVEHGAKLVGIIAYRPLSPRSGTLHGVCFDKSVHGAGIATEALKALLAMIFAGGIEKIQASYFADNQRVRRFLQKCGAVDEGYLKKQTLRDGKPVDMRMVAFWPVASEKKEVA